MAAQEPTKVEGDEQRTEAGRADVSTPVRFVVRFGEAADVPIMRVTDDALRSFLRRAHAND